MIHLWLLVGIALTIGCAFFFSFSETCLMSLDRYRIHFLVEKKGRRAALLSQILEKPETVLSPILLGNTLATTLTATFTSYLVGSLVTSGVLPLGAEVAQALGGVIIAIVILVFGEITPKSVAARSPESYVMGVVLPLRILSAVLSPLVQISLWASRGIIRILAPKRGDERDGILGPEELKAIIAHHGEQALPSDSMEMIRNLFELPSAAARDAMRPRSQVVMLEKGSRPEDALNLFLRHGFSILPVYDGEREHIVGVLHIRDLLRELGRSARQSRPARLERLLRPALYVPETAPLSEILRLFRSGRGRFAIVVDEIGQFEGIVTLEDVLEEIVGALGPQASDGRPGVVMEGTAFVVDGFMPLREFNRQFTRPLPADETYTTLAGFLMSRWGHVPDLQETLEAQGYRFTVLEREGYRIRQVRVEPLP